MSTDISTLGATYTHHLFRIPAFEQFQKAHKDGALAIADSLLPVISGVFADAHIELNEEFFDTYYQAVVEKTLTDLNQSLFAYRYLALTQDFRLIKQQYIRERARQTDSYVNTLKEVSGQLLVQELYIEQLKKEEKQLHSVEDTFEFVNHIDYVYLMVLIEISQSENEFVHRFVKARLETYNMMTVLRLTQMGKAYETIIHLLIDSPQFYSAGALKKLKGGDVVTEIGLLLGLKPDAISVNAIETFLLEKQIKAINQAMFFGTGQERVLQYFVKLHFFLYDIKLILAGHRLEMSSEQIDSRMLNYDLI